MYVCRGAHGWAGATSRESMMPGTEENGNEKKESMKLYDCTTAPSPQRVRIFLAEKGVDIPFVQVNLREGEQLGDAFRKINPDCTVPVLGLTRRSNYCLIDRMGMPAIVILTPTETR